MHAPLPTLLAALACLTTLPAQDAKDAALKVGDKAPALSIAKWVKGEPVARFAPDRVYVVEFWATWCGPCIQSIPHLSATQTAHKDRVTVIGVTTEDENNKLPAVEAFVKDKDAAMAYTIAFDDGKKTNNAWMEAAQQEGIPTAFLVDGKGVVAWIGHPMELDFALEPVLAGKPVDADEVKKAAEAMNKEMQKVFVGLGLAPKKGMELMAAFCTKYPFLTDMIEGNGVELLATGGHCKEAWELGKKVVDRAIANKDAMLLNQIAWTIVDPKAEIEQRDLDLALRAAQEAVKATKAKDASILDTLARALAWKKDFAQAIATQKQALALVGDGEEAESFKESLKEYEAAAKGAGGDGKDGKPAEGGKKEAGK